LALFAFFSGKTRQLIANFFSQEFGGVQRRQKYEVIFVSKPGTGTTKLFAVVINTVV
jgi:hypothetical protein